MQELLNTYDSQFPKSPASLVIRESECEKNGQMIYAQEVQPKASNQFNEQVESLGRERLQSKWGIELVFQHRFIDKSLQRQKHCWFLPVFSTAVDTVLTYIC